MKAIKLNEFLESFQKLELEEKEYALDIINKQIIEENRKRILKRSKQAIANFKNGKAEKGSVKDLLEDLEND